MRHQVIAQMEDTDASPPSISLKSRSRVSPAIIGVERPLPNGDIYSGELAGSAPHGYGKYIWIDGCVYVGEWINGWASGKGKLSWPSGATYEGDFKNGRMEGHGTFTGSSGETYHGCWIADRKHGYGRKSYGNGDFYEGQWRRDLQEGQGRYVWRNGNEYFGEWRSGMISGRGVLALANGDRCDGHWENGVPKRNGVFAWPDCSCYRNCNRDSKSRKQIDQTSFSTSKGSMKQLRNIPGLGMMELEFDEGDFASLLSGSEFGNTGEAARQTQTQWRDNTGDVKMMGQAVLKGHKSYGLVLGFQLGIRYTVGKTISKQLARLWPSDFDSREKVWTRFPPGGSKKTPPHDSADFKWKDYCPRVFRHLRRLFGVDPEAYVESICGIDSIRELASPGKSGSLFFQTQDGRFIIKTVKKCEVKILIRMLMNYYQHVYKYEDSLLTKYYGVHCVKPIGGQKVRFIVMGNLFCSDHVIHRRFDLKGSSHGRSIRMGEEEVDETTTLKDLDLNFVFHLQKPWFKKVMWQIELDCGLLEAEGIMDYSLLVGLHFNNDDKSAPQCKWDDDSELYHESALKSEVSSCTHKSFQSRENLIEFSFPESGKWDAAKLMDAREPAIRVGAGVPARAVEHAFHVSGSPEQAILLATPRSKNYEVALYFGIIDILRDYDISKRLEHAYKSLQADPLSISAVDPKLYSRRFRDFIGRVFVDDVEPEIGAYL